MQACLSSQMRISRNIATTRSIDKTPYIGHHGWVSIKSEEKIDWNEMGELIKEAYLRAAPKRVVKKFL